MSWLATRFIFELIGVGAAPDLSEPQALKNVFLQMIINRKNIYFSSYNFLKIAPHSRFDVRYE